MEINKRVFLLVLYVQNRGKGFSLEETFVRNQYLKNHGDF